MGVISESYIKDLAVKELERKVRYSKYAQYYAGRYTIRIPEKFKKELNNLGILRNYCAPVVDTYIAKLRFKGFIIESDNARKAIEETWKQNRMDATMIKLHRIAAKKGDAYAIVWPEPGEDGKVKIQVNSPEDIMAVTDPEDSEAISYYKKQWTVYDGEKSFVRKDLFYRDHIERAWSTEESMVWLPYTKDERPATYPNPYGILPVENPLNKVSEGQYGISELAPAIAIQDDINRLVMDMLMAAGYLGFGQIWITGVTQKEITSNNPNGLDRNPGAGWIIPRVEAKVGKLSSESMGGLLQAIRDEVQEMATITRTPLHYLQAKTAIPSGVALQELEGPLVDKVREAQTTFGNAYEDMNKIILKMKKIEETETEIMWEDPTAIVDVKKTQNDIALYNTAAISRKQLLRGQGYTEEQIKGIEKELEEEQAKLTKMVPSGE